MECGIAQWGLFITENVKKTREKLDGKLKYNYTVVQNHNVK